MYVWVVFWTALPIIDGEEGSMDGISILWLEGADFVPDWSSSLSEEVPPMEN